MATNLGPIPKPTKHQLKGETPAEHYQRVKHLKSLGYRGHKKVAYKKIRDAFLADHKSDEGEWWTCNICGCTTMAPEVDHIIKRSVAPHLVLEPANLQILCHTCHQVKDNGMVVK